MENIEKRHRYVYVDRVVASNNAIHFHFRVYYVHSSIGFGYPPRKTGVRVSRARKFYCHKRS